MSRKAKNQMEITSRELVRHRIVNAGNEVVTSHIQIRSIEG